MNDFIGQYWPEIVSSILAIFAIIISINAWSKSRVIYSLERTTLRQTRGRKDDWIVTERLNEINDKLMTGKYTIVSVVVREADGDFEIILGRVKK